MKRSHLLQELKPFFLRWLEQGADAGLTVGEGPGIDLVGATVGLGGDLPLVLHADGSPASEYATAQAACAAATSGERVELQAGVYSENLTVPAGVVLAGRGPATVIAGTVTLEDGAAIVDCTVDVSGDDAGDLVCIVPPDEGMAYVVSCELTAHNATGNGFCVYGACDHVTLLWTRASAQSARVQSVEWGGWSGTGSETVVLSQTADTKAVTLWNGAANDTPPAGWQSVAFDDASWGAAVLASSEFSPPEGAACLWSSQRILGPYEECLLRQPFVLDGMVTGATLYFRGDDFADIYINGTLVHQDLVGGVPGDIGPEETVFLSPLVFQAGGNVIAVHAKDGLATSAPSNKAWAGWRLEVETTVANAKPYVHGCVIPSIAGRALAIPLHGDRATWRTDGDGEASHADDWEAGDSHHAPVTLGEGSDPALTMNGQELTLADVLTPAEHAAIDHSGYDATAIHEDEAGEIHGIAEKETLEDDDEVLIEDSSSGYVKKRVKIANLPAGSGGSGTLANAGYQETVGDGVNTEYTVTHNLGTWDVLVQVYDLGVTPREKVDPEIEAISPNAVVVTFQAAPSADQYRVLVMAVDVGGVSTFIGLTDTPSSYAGMKGRIPYVKQDETGLEFL